jgi:chromosome segregation and condensation protein ScpB
LTIYDLVGNEMVFGEIKYGKYHNSHEHYAVLKEELDEYWDDVKANKSETPQAMYELVQVAAVALRYVLERGDLESIREVQDKRHAV